MTEAVSRRSYKQVTVDDNWDAIVVGSGIGGLTAAVLLSRYGGKRVLLLERHYAIGGFTHTFHRPGYEWDVGLHYIGQVQNDTSSVRRAFDHVTEGTVQWNAMPEVYDRIIVNGQTFDLTRGLEQYREGMKRYFPSEVRAIDKYIAAVQSSNRASGLYYAEKAVPDLVSRIAGGLMRAPFLRWAKRTTAEVLRDLTTNQGGRELNRDKNPEFPSGSFREFDKARKDCPPGATGPAPETGVGFHGSVTEVGFRPLSRNMAKATQ